MVLSILQVERLVILDILRNKPPPLLNLSTSIQDILLQKLDTMILYMLHLLVSSWFDRCHQEIEHWTSLSGVGSWNLKIWELGNLGTWELGNLRTWEFGNLGTWELWNLGTWELGKLGTWELGTSWDKKKFTQPLWTKKITQPVWNEKESRNLWGQNKKSRNLLGQKKSRIRETKHLSTDADSSTKGWTKNTEKPKLKKRKKSPKMQKLKNV